LKQVLLAIERDCLGFDPSQALSEDSDFTRVPIRLFSQTAYLLALRMPVGRFMRQARFLVDLEAPDGQTVVPLDGGVSPFHERCGFYRSRPGRQLEDVACIADYARIFCLSLAGPQEGTIRYFVPIETAQQVRDVAIGPIPPDVMSVIQPFVRHTGTKGCSALPGTIHLFSGPLSFGTPLFRVLLMLVMPKTGGNTSIVMIQDQQIAENLPVVPITPDPLTFAFFPLRRHQA
jgi:hypothetical protein